MTPEQEDSILQALRPLVPNQDPEQLRQIIRTTLVDIPSSPEGVAEMEQQLLKQFPGLEALFKTP